MKSDLIDQIAKLRSSTQEQLYARRADLKIGGLLGSDLILNLKRFTNQPDGMDELFDFHYEACNSLQYGGSQIDVIGTEVWFFFAVLEYRTESVGGFHADVMVYACRGILTKNSRGFTELVDIDCFLKVKADDSEHGQKLVKDKDWEIATISDGEFARFFQEIDQYVMGISKDGASLESTAFSSVTVSVLDQYEENELSDEIEAKSVEQKMDSIRVGIQSECRGGKVAFVKPLLNSFQTFAIEIVLDAVNNGVDIIAMFSCEDDTLNAFTDQWDNLGLGWDDEDLPEKTGLPMTLENEHTKGISDYGSNSEQDRYGEGSLVVTQDEFDAACSQASAQSVAERIEKMLNRIKEDVGQPEQVRYCALDVYPNGYFMEFFFPNGLMPAFLAGWVTEKTQGEATKYQNEFGSYRWTEVIEEAFRCFNDPLARSVAHRGASGAEIFNGLLDLRDFIESMKRSSVVQGGGSIH